MAIDDVKPPGSFDPLSDPSADAPANGAKKGGFGPAVERARGSEADQSVRRGLRVEASFDKSALADPEKLKLMVRACASELIDSGSTVAGQLSAAQKQSLQDFLSEDPLIRAQIENYLRKVLA